MAQLPSNDIIKVVSDRADEVIHGITEMTKTAVYVGYPSTTAGRRDVAITNATIAYIHEYGSPINNIPARPSLVPGVRSAKDKIAGHLRMAAIYAIRGNQNAWPKSLNAAGIDAVSAVKQKIITGPFAPLADSTLAARRSRGVKRTSPLIDTAQMLNAVNYVLRRRR